MKIDVKPSPSVRSVSMSNNLEFPSVSSPSASEVLEKLCFGDMANNPNHGSTRKMVVALKEIPLFLSLNIAKEAFEPGEELHGSVVMMCTQPLPTERIKVNLLFQGECKVMNELVIRQKPSFSPQESEKASKLFNVYPAQSFNNISCPSDKEVNKFPLRSNTSTLLKPKKRGNLGHSYSLKEEEKEEKKNHIKKEIIHKSIDLFRFVRTFPTGIPIVLPFKIILPKKLPPTSDSSFDEIVFKENRRKNQGNDQVQ